MQRVFGHRLLQRPYSSLNRSKNHTSIQRILTWTQEQLDEADIPSARMEARVLVANAVSPRISPEELMWKDDVQLHWNEDELSSAVRRRCQGEPLAYIVGEKEFWSLAFKVSRATLIPRPDSETVIEALLERYRDPTQDLRILDLGVGSGNLLLSALSEYPHARGLGLDCSIHALDIARENAAQLRLEHRCAFDAFDFTCPFPESLSPYQHTVNVILSNPPYIRREDLDIIDPSVLAYEPHVALFAKHRGLFAYESIAALAHTFLKPAATSRSPGSERGTVILEIGIGQQHDVVSIFKQHHFDWINTIRDIQGIERCLVFEHQI